MHQTNQPSNPPSLHPATHPPIQLGAVHRVSSPRLRRLPAPPRRSALGPHRDPEAVDGPGPPARRKPLGGCSISLRQRLEHGTASSQKSDVEKWAQTLGVVKWYLDIEISNGSGT